MAERNLARSGPATDSIRERGKAERRVRVIEVADKLRHSSVTTTLGVYGHLFPGTDDRVKGLLADTFADSGADSARTPRGHSRE